MNFIASLISNRCSGGRAFQIGTVFCVCILAATLLGFCNVEAATDLSSYTLVWEAPGDDGADGTASAYDLRYSTDSVLLVNNFELANSVIGMPSPSPAGQQDSFTVSDLEGGSTYYFVLKTIDEVGNVSDISNIVKFVGLALGYNDDEVLPMDISLSQNYPNPFNPSTTIEYSVPINSHVRLTIYNIQGRTIATLVDGIKLQGQYEQTWNGTNELGSQVASGIYFYRLETSLNTKTKKMVLLK